jgi:Cu(I)/Ag(I) efflux system membrane fusion protein
MKKSLIYLITIFLAVLTTWWALRFYHHEPEAASRPKPMFYQSAMHPWIKSDKPGRCTICGMELTPVYPGEKGIDSTADGDFVALTNQQIEILNLQTDVAKVQPLVRSLQVAGTIDDDATRHRVLAAYVDGRIDRLHVNHPGAEVEAGQPLADFYSPTLLQAEREYGQLGGVLRANAGLRLRQLGLTPEQIEGIATKPLNALNSPILSPIGGTVVRQNIYEGQYVSAGQPLFEIADFSTMWFMFRAYEQDIPWIKTGQTITVTTPSQPNKSFVGTINFIDPNFDEATRSTQVRVELANPKVDGRRDLMHKLYADGVVQVDAPEVLAIPRSAIIQTGPEALVYVAQASGAFTRAVVQTGRRGDALVEIRSGLRAGDQVVTHGNLLIDGQAELTRAYLPDQPHAEAQPMANELSESQQLAVTQFVAVADAMAQALSVDDLSAFLKASEPSIGVTRNLIESIHGLSNHQSLADSANVHDDKTLQAARAGFLTFALAATTALEPLRKMKGCPEFQIWECSMVDQAVAGAERKGRWIQTRERTGGNPFYGKAMPDCGKEIKP